MRPSVCDELIKQAQAVRAAGKQPLVVFDLDGTLYDNRPRTLRIMMEFAFASAVERPHLLEGVRKLALNDVEYLAGDTLAKVGLTDGEDVKALMAYWMTCFFTDSYVAMDLPVPHGATFVNRLHEAGVIPVYLTGRDAPNMLIGTLQALQRDGFQAGTVDTRIILKECFERPDVEYKTEVITKLRRSGEVIAAFDNEPGLCNLFKESFPDATVGFIDTSFAPGAPPLREDILQSPDFRAFL